MIKLGIFTPNPKDSTSLYRCLGPWSYYKQGVDLVPINADELTWNNLALIDVLFMHRPFEPRHMAAMHASQKLNIPVWIDFDDDLFNVHLSNDNHMLYDNPQTSSNLIKLLKYANIVTASTVALANSLKQQSNGRDILVLNNKLPDHLTGNIIGDDFKKAPTKRILWRGTKHHEMNLKHFEAPIVDCIKQRPDWVWTFYGWRPWYLMEQSNPCQTEHMADADQFSFFESLRKINASIQIVPLVDNKFNQSKSNIALLEGSAYGQSLIIAPAMPEWIVPGVINYSDRESLRDSILMAMEFDKTKLDEMRFSTRKWVKEHGLMSSPTNTKRMDVLNYLSHNILG